MNAHVPHLRVVVGFCIAALVGYSVFSAYVVFEMRDAALTGDVIGTWKSFAVGVFGFWVGSSSAGKAKETGPVQTEIVNTASEPVPTTTQRQPLPRPTFGQVDNPDGEQQ
jgi:hypothetical protein